MLVRKRVVLKNRRRQRAHRCCGLTVKDVLQFVSSLILPLMLGVFTVVITFQQRKLAQEQRTEDINLSRQQRLEDRNDSQLQREEDRNESRLYREQDREESQVQREQDKNDSRLQREQDWTIAQLAQAAQNKAVNDRYQDEVLLAYIKEVGDMLKENNGSLTSDSLIHTLARVKTLNSLRQLDGTRQIHIIRFLHEAGQLTNTNGARALDLSTAELIAIDFRKSGQLLTVGEISLAGVYLVNSTLSDMPLENVNFSFARFTNVNFSSAQFSNVNFSSVQLSEINFSYAKFKNVDLSSSTSTDVNFCSAMSADTNFRRATFQYVNFSSVQLMDGDLSSTIFTEVDFSFARLYGINFQSASFTRINFSSTEFSNINFLLAYFDDISFSSAQFSGTTFSFGSFTNSNFSSALFKGEFPATRFDYAKLPRTIFDECNMEGTAFYYANLEYSSFHSVTFSSVNFSFAILQNADFSNSTVTGKQLQDAVSIRNAKLPNGTLIQAQNLIKNGYAGCSISITDHWQVRYGSIVIASTRDDSNECRFSPQFVALSSMMSQALDVAYLWNYALSGDWNLELEAQMSDGVSIELIGKNKNDIVSKRRIANATHNKFSIRLSPDIEILEVVVIFDALKNNSDTKSSWCDNIELFIVYEN